MTIGDRDKVFADLGNPQSAATPTRRAIQAKRSWAWLFADLGSHIRQDSLSRRHCRLGPGRLLRRLAGSAPGLVITRINKQPTGTKDQFDAIVSKLKTGDDVVFEVVDPRHPELGINYIGGTL